MAVLPRRTGFASVATLAVMAAGMAVAHLVAPGWSRSAGLDVWNAGAAEREYQRATARGRDLDDFRDRLGRQLRATESVVRDLAAGRLTLAAAAAELERVNGGRVGFLDGLDVCYPHLPDFRHRVARYAVDKAAARYANDSAEWEATEARLEAEFAALRAE